MAYQPANFGQSNKPSRNKKTKKAQKVVVHHDKALGLNKSALPHSIIEVVSTLTKAGFEAYIVGGGVRDSLLGLAPKDFDAVTSARPHEIKAIFGGRCRIIGRRFQLAHVYSGREMIEVATFRAPPKDDTHTTEDGTITRHLPCEKTTRPDSVHLRWYRSVQGRSSGKGFAHGCGRYQGRHRRRTA